MFDNDFHIFLIALGGKAAINLPARAKLDSKYAAVIEWINTNFTSVRRNAMLAGIVLLVMPRFILAPWHFPC